MMTKLASITAITLLVVAASAQERQKPPAGGEPKPFTVPARQTISLKNGLKATMVSYGEIPKVTIRAVVRAGNLNEAPNQVWLADLTGDLMEEGAAKRSSAELAQEAARMGGQLSVTVSPDQTFVAISVLSEFAGEAIALVADVLRQPALPASELSRLKADLVRRLTVAKSTPQAIANELFLGAIYPNHPYGRVFPTEEMLKTYSIDDVQKFYKANFGAQRTHVYVAGRFDRGIEKSLRQAFESWVRGPDVYTNVPKNTAKKVVLVSDRPGAAQSNIRLGLRLPGPTHKDYVPLQVTNSLLGGAFMSRITTNIREQKGFSYSPFSALSSRYHDTHWVENADVTTAVTGAALKEIYGEIERLRQAAPAADELKGITTLLAGTFVLQNSSPGGIIGQLNFVDLQGLDDSWLRTYTQRVAAVSPAEVQRIAETYLDPNKMTLVVVGDQSKVRDQIEPFRKGVE
jgi:predicted Zn-dependent peptidase